ncbi:hypothetical protein GMORB2_3685 [Geosmithia morbida]|uniref:Uncharacterized protein n=1 Tax=Geosmithia morbida TaxID=1094350 RepID=A0A9P5D5S0_9HYPO|nr:uncharacterized protein GMORB2_3685 [Geosmithia morbida]KAF4124846.1 hypothetical protein GMORB2_3685 [Geosmithia morbida]
MGPSQKRGYNDLPAMANKSAGQRQTAANTNRRPVRSLRIHPPPTQRQIAAKDDGTQTSLDVKDGEDVLVSSIAALTLDVPLVPLRPKRRVPSKPFPLLMLPPEVRIRIYEYFFADADSNRVLDLAPSNYRDYHRKLGLMRVNRQIHEEATHYFYSSRTFRIFPTFPGRYFKTKKPLLSRLKKNQRQCITSLELRLGPGFNAPPKGWIVNDALGLADCSNVRKLSVFVECDPSDGVFKGFRRAEGFYEGFSRSLLSSVLEAMPPIGAIEFDAWTSVKMNGAMMGGLIDIAKASGYPIRWGPERGWTDSTDDGDDILRYTQAALDESEYKRAIQTMYSLDSSLV